MAGYLRKFWCKEKTIELTASEVQDLYKVAYALSDITNNKDLDVESIRAKASKATKTYDEIILKKLGE